MVLIYFSNFRFVTPITVVLIHRKVFNGHWMPPSSEVKAPIEGKMCLPLEPLRNRTIATAGRHIRGCEHPLGNWVDAPVDVRRQ